MRPATMRITRARAAHCAAMRPRRLPDHCRTFTRLTAIATATTRIAASVAVGGSDIRTNWTSSGSISAIGASAPIGGTGEAAAREVVTSRGIALPLHVAPRCLTRPRPLHFVPTRDTSLGVRSARRRPASTPLASDLPRRARVVFVAVEDERRARRLREFSEPNARGPTVTGDSPALSTVALCISHRGRISVALPETDRTRRTGNEGAHWDSRVTPTTHQSRGRARPATLRTAPLEPPSCLLYTSDAADE